jgi:hypothetical protein
MTVQLTTSRPTTTEAHEAPAATRTVLVLATPNIRWDELIRRMRAVALRGDVRFEVVVPAVPAGLDWLADMSAGRARAEERLRNLLWRCGRHELPVRSATVGSPDPVAAAMDAVNLGEVDEIVVATTRPRAGLRRLGLSLADRVRRATGVPVEHLVAGPVRRHGAAAGYEPAAAGLDPAGVPLAMS